MKILNRSIFIYGFWLLTGLLLWVLIKNHALSNPIFFSFGFLYLIFLPGWLVSRLIKFSSSEILVKFLGYFVLGLSYYLLINFLAIIFNWDLNQLIFVIFYLMAGLFLASLTLELIKSSLLNIDFKKILSWDNIFYLLPLLVGGFIFYLIALSGPNLNGDPYLHLSIIQKAFEGDSLAARSLALTKTQIINPAYAYPVWQIFLAFLSRVFSVDVFTMWTNILYVLTVFSFLAWYMLSKVIFQEKIWTILAFLVMIIFTLYGGPGYLFTRLGVPDTFSQLILLPFSLAISLKYIFDAEKKLWSMIILSSFLLIAVHAPHYFYLLVSTIFLGVFYTVLYFKDKEYKLIIERILKVFFFQLSILIVIGLIMELKSRTISSTILEFNKVPSFLLAYDNFLKFGLVYKYGYFLLPLASLSLFKSKRYLFVIMSLLLTPIIYWTPLRDILSKALSLIFTDRLLANTSFYFFVFTPIFGVLILLIDKLIIKMAQKMLTIYFLIITFLGLVIFENLTHKISDFVYLVFYAKSTNIYINTHVWWFLGLGIVLAIVCLMLFRAKQYKLNWQYQSLISTFLLISILSFVLISPSFVNAQILEKESKMNVRDYFLISINNNPNPLTFLESLDQKSVILANGSVSKALAVLTNKYMAYNVGSAYEENFRWVFDKSNPDQGKAEIVISPKWQIDYVYLENSLSQNSHFKIHPEFYQLIYSNGKTEIYKVIK